MPALMIKCPETGLPITTGISVDEKSFESSSFSGNQVDCPYCGKMHTWSKEDVINFRPKK